MVVRQLLLAKDIVLQVEVEPLQQGLMLVIQGHLDLTEDLVEQEQQQVLQDRQ